MSVPLPGEDFGAALARAGHPDGLGVAELEIFQVNIGKLCNMRCRHCHVDAGPEQTVANMDLRTVEACLRALDQTPAHTVDITGGAPELNPHFVRLVEGARARGRHVIDRCNLTVLLLPRFEALPAWLAEQGVEIVASLPHPRSHRAKRSVVPAPRTEERPSRPNPSRDFLFLHPSCLRQ